MLSFITHNYIIQKIHQQFINGSNECLLPAIGLKR